MHLLYEKIDNVSNDEYLMYSKRFNCNFNTIKDKEHLLGLILLDRLFSKYYHFSIKTVCYYDNGKPFIDGYYFSISHSKGMVIVVINDNNIGIDIEVKRKYNKLVINKLFNSKIKSLIKNDYDYIDWFTKYEALYKLDGSNINDVVLDRYSFNTFDIDDYICNICIKK